MRESGIQPDVIAYTTAIKVQILSVTLPAPYTGYRVYLDMLPFCKMTGYLLFI